MIKLTLVFFSDTSLLYYWCLETISLSKKNNFFSLFQVQKQPFDFNVLLTKVCLSPNNMLVPFQFKVGSYHASSLFVATRPPTSGVVSRGIGVEGVSTVLAGLWGTGVGSSTITENVHTIAVTKMGSRRAVGFGAILLLLLSIVGKKLVSHSHFGEKFLML